METSLADAQIVDRFRVVAWQESDAFDWQKFPSYPLQAAPTAYHFDVAPDPRVEVLLGPLSGAEDWNSFLAENSSQAFIVTQDGAIRGSIFTITNITRSCSG